MEQQPHQGIDLLAPLVEQDDRDRAVGQREDQQQHRHREGPAVDPVDQVEPVMILGPALLHATATEPPGMPGWQVVLASVARMLTTVRGRYFRRWAVL